MRARRKPQWIFLAVLVLAATNRPALADVFTNPGIPGVETANLNLVYDFPIPVASPGWNNGANNPYTTDNSGSIASGSFLRVGYYLELTKPDTSIDWVYVSFDAAGFTNDATKIGLPTTGSGEYYNFANTSISNMNVYSNVAGIATGTGITTGNVEFWPSNYGGGNSYGVPGADGGTYDFGDGGSNTSSGHGTMQIHNYGASQTLFAYNAWGSARTSELGIGNQPSGHPDWTFNTSNISNYASRLLQILVDIPPELTWDGSVNDWGTAHWAGSPPTFPDASSKAIVNGGKVTVEADHAAYVLTMNGGEVAVGAGNTLSVIGNLDASGGLVSMGAGATLSIGGGALSNYSDGGNTATLLKTGGGTLTLDNSASGISAAGTTMHVNQGTLGAIGTSPLGGAAEVVLAGGTLALQGANTGLADGLRGSIFFNTSDNENPVNLDGADYQSTGGRIFIGDKAGTVLALSEDSNNNVVVTGSTQNWSAWAGGFDGNADHFVTAFSGRFFPQVDGTYNFHWNNDDRGLMFIDLNDDGTFDSSERVAAYAWNSNGNVDLTAGQGYNVIYMAQEFGGGQGVWWAFTPPGGSESIVNPGTQAGMWKYEQVGAIDASSTPVTVTANSAMQANSDVSATLGPLTLNNGTTLSTSGAPTTFQSTSIAGPAGRSGAINNSNSIDIGSYNDGGVASTFIKQGTGPMTVDNTTPGRIVGGSTHFRVEGGTLTATGIATNGSDLLGGPATITLAGGTLELRSPTGMPGGLQAWYDASTLHYADGDSVATWTDVSGNGHTATLTGGSMTFVADQINGQPVVRFADSTYANAVGNMYAKEQYIVVKLDSGDWGAFLGSQVRSGYLLNQNGNFWNQNYPEAVSKNGTALTTPPYSLGDNQPFMVLKITGNDFDTSLRTYALGRQEGWGRLAMDLAEILAFDHALTPAEEEQVGGYLAAKYGITAATYTGSLNLQPLNMSGTAVRVEGSSTLQAIAAPSGSFGSLTMQSGTLTLGGMPGGVSFASGGVDAAATGFGLNSPMNVTIGGPYDGNHAAGTFTKSGAGSLTFTQGTMNHEGVSVQVDGGRIVTNGAMQAANLKIGSDGDLDTGANNLTISAGGRMRTGSLTITASSAPFQVGGDNMAAGPARMTLNGGTVTVANDVTMPSGLQAWYDASTMLLVNGSAVNSWDDLSGNGHTATTAAGTLTLATNQVGGLPAVQFRNNGYATLDGDMFSKEQIIVFSLPGGGNWGAVVGSGQRSGYLLNPSGYFWDQNYPEAVSQNGGPELTPNFQLTSPANFMALRITGNDSDTTVRSGWALGRQEGWYSNNMNLAEVLVFDRVLTSAEESDIGAYLAAKYGIATDYVGAPLTRPEVNLPDTAVLVTATTTLAADTPATATFGDLSIQSGADLTLAGAQGGFSFKSLSGSSTISLPDAANMTIRETLSPGNSIGTIAIDGNFVVGDGMVYEWEVVGTGTPPGYDADLTSITGDLTFEGDWVLNVTEMGFHRLIFPDEQFVLFEYGGDLNGFTQPTAINVSHLLPDQRWDGVTPFVFDTGYSLVLTGLLVVPEPSTLAMLLGLGGVGLLGFLRRRRRR